MTSLIAKAIEDIEAAAKKTDGLLGVPSGFTALDRITGGWQKSDLLILAARPGMGKTAFVVSMAKNAAVDYNRPVAIFSLEMSSVQLVKRLISSETEITQDKILKGNLDNHEFVQLNERIKKLSVAPLYIDDTPALSIFELRAKARRLKEQQKIEMIIIDYLQLMSGGPDSKGNREQEISAISRGLKSLAKELEIPIIALSQLSRQVENRPGNSKRPQLSDLRESGAIEQDADVVVLLMREEYYNPTEENRGIADHLGQSVWRAGDA
jgi:replicative DNA helicase